MFDGVAGLCPATLFFNASNSKEFAVNLRLVWTSSLM